MWKFNLKRDSWGNISKYIASILAKGDQYEPDWNLVLTPTARYTSLRVILALAFYNDLEIEQIDVVTTFLNAEVDSNIYIEHPN